MLTRHEANTRGRDFFVGDLHGQYCLLQEALQGVDFSTTEDRLFCVGDLIDRGADSLDCLKLAFMPWFHAVCGNHEDLAWNAFCDGEGSSAWELWMINGGGWVIDSGVNETRRILQAALSQLPLAREVAIDGRKFGMVHAEPPIDWLRIEEADRDSLIWGRSRIQQSDETPVVGVDAVVVGHTIVERPLTLGNVHYLDTGAFSTGRLTLVDAKELLRW
ncbi:metallophosphoesterase [Halomonas daqiaonensis]|uniref:Serine/threonine protein phosphatase 1 n=1 Tax=Halomonas daqiaonensis TaxID=650850 RepID=A0A1H7F768_9GAMM|nr:metallophosphoesterase [Halomonas daqiaonensis]SEK21858.1 serine/threonine protein phosphatase 1 [Halomonas daqiaonensis]